MRSAPRDPGPLQELRAADPRLLRVWSAAEDAPAAGAALALDGVPLEPEREDLSLFQLPACAGEANLEVDATGHFPMTLSAREALDLEVVDGVRRIDLQALGRLIVHVSDEEGRDAEAAYVQVFPIDPRTGGRTPELPRPWPDFVRQGTVSEDYSRFLIPGSTASDGTLVVPALPCRRRLVVSVRSGTESVSKEVVIDPAIRTERVEIKFAASTRIHGTLQWPDGTPAGAVLVRLSNCDPAGTDTLIHPSDAQGRFEFGNARRGCKLWGPQVPGVEPRVVEVRLADHDLGTLVIPRPRVLPGRIVAASLPRGVSLAGLEVVATRAGIVLDRALTDRDGRFELRSPFEDVALEVEALGRGRLPHEFAGPLVAPVEVDVDRRCGSVRFDPSSGEGLLLVEFRSREGRSAIRVFAEPEGLAVEMHPEGGCTLHLIPEGNYALRVERADGTSAWLPELRVPRGRTVAAAGLEFGLGAIEGRVVDSGGACLNGVAVSLVEEGRSRSSPSRRVHSDEAGRFRFERVAPGAWRVTSTTAEAVREAGVSTAVAPGRAAKLDVVVDGFGQLIGRIATGTRAPPPALRLLPGGSRFGAEPMLVLEPSPDGGFGPVAIVAGDYVLGTSYHDAQGRLVEHWREVSVDAGGTSTVRFEIPDAVELTFRSDGKALERLADGHVWFPGGQATIVRSRGDGTGPTADLSAGPWLFAVRTIEDRDPKAVDMLRGFAVALVPDGPISEGRLDVELAHGTLSVGTGARADLAGRLTCDLVGLSGAQGLMPIGAGVRLRGRVTEEGDALFEHLPQGARLRVRGPDGTGGSSALDVDLTTSMLVLDWPPRAP